MGRQRGRKDAELSFEVRLEILGRVILLFRRAPLLGGRLFGGVPLRVSDIANDIFQQINLVQRSSCLLQLHLLLLLQPLLGSLRLLLQSLFQLLLLAHERLHQLAVPLIALPPLVCCRCCCCSGGRGGSAPILLEALLHRRGCGGRSAPILDLLLHQLLHLLLLLLQKAKDYTEVGARSKDLSPC